MISCMLCASCIYGCWDWLYQLPGWRARMQLWGYNQRLNLRLERRLHTLNSRICLDQGRPDQTQIEWGWIYAITDLFFTGTMQSCPLYKGCWREKKRKSLLSMSSLLVRQMEEGSTTLTKSRRLTSAKIQQSIFVQTKSLRWQNQQNNLCACGRCQQLFDHINKPGTLTERQNQLQNSEKWQMCYYFCFSYCCCCWWCEQLLQWPVLTPSTHTVKSLVAISASPTPLASALAATETKASTSHAKRTLTV